MIKKIVSFILAVLLLNVGMGTVYAKTNAEKETRYAEKVKQAITKLGTGETAVVKIKLRDKMKLEGFISAIGDDSFVVTDGKTGVTTTVAYPQVKQVKGNNLSTGAKIAIGLGIAIAVVIIIAAASGNIGRARDLTRLRF